MPSSPLATPALTSARGFAAGGQTPVSARPSTSSGEKLVDEIQKMMRTVGHNLMLEKERDAAKRNYDSALKIYKETMSMKEAFPSTEYLARQDRDEAQATFDRLEHELRQAEASFSAKNIARYLEDLVPAAATSKPSRALEEELVQNKRQIDSLNVQIKNLVARLNDAEAEITKIDTTARSASGQASKQSNRIDDIHQRQLHSMTYIGKVPEIEKKVNDLTAAAATPTPSGVDAGQVELLRKRVVGLENQMSNVMSSQKGLDGKLAVIATNGAGKTNSGAASPSNPELWTRLMKLEEGQQSHEAEVQLVNEKVTASETGLKELATVQQRVDKDLQQLNQNMESFDEDIFKLSKQVDALESAAAGSSPAAQPRPTNPDAMDVDTALTQATPRRGAAKLSDRAEAARKELKVSPAVFKALGEIPAKLSGLLGMKEYLAEAQGEAFDQLQAEFTQQLGQLRDDILPRIQALDAKENDLESKHTKLQTDHESLYHQTAVLAALPQPAATQQGKLSVPQGLHFAAIEGLSKKIDELDNKYGILHRGLDTRMQNTHTGALAHQILGSLQSAYPNLSNTDEAIRQSNIARQQMEKQIEDLKKKSDKVREVVNMQGLEVKVGKKTRVEMETLAQELRERVEEIRKVVESRENSGENGGGAGGVDQIHVRELKGQMDEMKRMVDGIMGGTINGGAKVVTQDQSFLQNMRADIHRLHNDLDAVKQTAEDAKKAMQRVKLDVNDKLRAFDMQLEEFREKITFEDEDTVKEKIQVLTDFARNLEEEVGWIKEKYKANILGGKHAGDKRSASAATSPHDSDVPMMGNVERKKRKRKKRNTGAFIADEDDEDPYE